MAKSSPRIAALGDVDELNSVLGLLLTEPLPASAREQLLAVQHDLFDLGGELSIPGRSALADAHVARIEAWTAELNAALPPLKEFILPGGSRAAATAHVARTVCRRAERAVVGLAAVEAVSTTGRIYLNRLSDALFVLARALNRFAGQGDVLWQPGRTIQAPSPSGG